MWKWVSVTGLILVFYVLSTGPAWRLMHRRVVSWNAFHYFYMPLETLAVRSELFNRIYYGYLDLWRRGVPLNNVAGANIYGGQATAPPAQGR